jgi:CheY-like chemotaxis protein
MKRILVVEDDPVMCEIIRDILQLKGLEVEAVNGV